MNFNFRHINRLLYPTKHILVCEDNLDNQSSIAKHFSDTFGAEHLVQCSFVSGSLAASAILSYCQIDLILLDHDMPHGNGIDLLKWMKNTGNKTPVITFSGIPYNNISMMQNGANHLFGKGDVINGDADELIKNILQLSEKQNIETPVSEQTVTKYIKTRSSSDPNTWEIPSASDLTGYPLDLSDDQLQASVLMLWKQYMINDEVMNAINFLENAPYNVRNTLLTKRAIKITENTIAWIDQNEEAQKINAPQNTDIECGTALPHELPIGSQDTNRFNMMRDNLKPNSKIVDFGCLDGCFTNRFGMLGHDVTGLDLCVSSVALANKKAEEFNTNAKHIATYFKDALNLVENHSFEYATSSDTYEHIKDPVADMLVPAKKLLKEDGVFLLCTPHGSWMRGNYIEWAYPWLYERQGLNWLNTPWVHLRAPTVWEVAADFNKAGFYVNNSYVMLCLGKSDVEGQGNVFAEAFVTGPQCDNPLNIVLYNNDFSKEWTPKQNNGIEESSLIETSKQLAKMGHNVSVYNNCGKWGEGIYDGVKYYQFDKCENLNCNMFISYCDFDIVKTNIKSNFMISCHKLHNVDELIKRILEL